MNYQFALGETVSYPPAGPASNPFKVMWRMPSRMTLCQLYGIKSNVETTERTVLETDLVALPGKETISEIVKRLCR